MTPGSLKEAFARCLRAAGLAGVAGLALAGFAPVGNAADVTVTEGERATFQITVEPRRNPFRGGPRIRVFYAGYGGTATPGDGDHGAGVDGADYEWLNPWVRNVEGRVGQPMTVSVLTYRDDLVKGDETFRIEVVGIQVEHRAWLNTSRNEWTVTGLPTITIKDATPPPPINWGLTFCYWSSC